MGCCAVIYRARIDLKQHIRERVDCVIFRIKYRRISMCAKNYFNRNRMSEEVEANHRQPMLSFIAN